MCIFETTKITQIYVMIQKRYQVNGQAKYVHFKIGNYCSAVISLFYLTKKNFNKLNSGPK